jgi:HK97 family phage major capsid protein
MRLKELTEKRNAIVEEMKAITGKATTENRAVTPEEDAKFDELDKELRSLDATIKMEERARDLQLNVVSTEKKEELTQEQMEIRSFASYIRSKMGSVVENRAGEQNITMGNNGDIIPVTIAQMIIVAVKDICPIFAKSTMYNVKGTLKVPVWGLANTTHDIAVGYQTEFNEITADAGKFTSVDLGGFLAGSLALIGKSVANNSDLNVVNFVVQYMAEQIAIFLEKELLTGIGTTAATGILNTTNTLNAGSISAITADKLIALQGKVKKVYQKNACWTMTQNTWTAVRQLKDSTGNYLVQPGLNGEAAFMLLGKPVEISDNMPEIGSANKAILYADYSALSVNMRENIETQVLLEQFATKHAIGVIAWFEFDSKITNNQKCAALVMSV